MTCSTEGCDRSLYCRAMCQRCYMRQYKAANRERMRELGREYEARNRQELNARRRDRYQNDPESRTLRQAANRRSAEKNRDAIRERNRRRYERNTGEINAKARVYYISKRYGLDPEGYAALLESQGYCCAICGTSEPVMGRFHVDHCHDTGKVRGLLCHKCNCGIGMLTDSPTVVFRAAQYLADHANVRSVA